MSRTATLVWDVGSLWDPFRALAERAARSSSFDVRVPIYKWPDQATVYSLLQLYRSLSQANGSVPLATRAALALVAAPLFVPCGVSLREYGLSPRAIVEDRELWRCAVACCKRSRLHSCLGTLMRSVQPCFGSLPDCRTRTAVLSSSVGCHLLEASELWV